MSKKINRFRVVAFLDSASTYPYTSPSILTGISVFNRDATKKLVVVANNITIPVPPGSAWDGDIGTFENVNVTSPTGEYYIELRGE